MSAVRVPAEVFNPREFVREELAERGMSEDALPVSVRRWLGTDAEMTGMVAQALSALLGTSTQFWQNLEDAWECQGEATA